MPQFDTATYPSQIFWLVICFGLLCIVMAHWLIPRLTSIMEARKQQVQEDWEQWKEFDTASKALHQENLKYLAEARRKAHLLIHQTIRDIHHKKLSQVALLDEELLEQTQKALFELESQTQDILRHIEPIVCQVMKATDLRILGQSLSQLETKKIVHTTLTKREQT